MAKHLDEPRLAPDTAGSAGIAAALALGAKHGEKTLAGLRTHLTPDGLRGGVSHSTKGGEAPVVTVVGVEGDEVLLDGSHPLAGVELAFDVEVVGARDATAEELSHGHAHGGGGAGGGGCGEGCGCH